MKTDKAAVVTSKASNGDGLMRLKAGAKGTGETLHTVRYWPWSPKSVEGAENLIQNEAESRGLTIVYDPDDWS